MSARKTPMIQSVRSWRRDANIDAFVPGASSIAARDERGPIRTEMRLLLLLFRQQPGRFFVGEVFNLGQEGCKFGIGVLRGRMAAVASCSRRGQFAVFDAHGLFGQVARKRRGRRVVPSDDRRQLDAELVLELLTE